MSGLGFWGKGLGFRVPGEGGTDWGRKLGLAKLRFSRFSLHFRFRSCLAKLRFGLKF